MGIIAIGTLWIVAAVSAFVWPSALHVLVPLVWLSLPLLCILDRPRKRL